VLAQVGFLPLVPQISTASRSTPLARPAGTAVAGAGCTPGRGWRVEVPARWPPGAAVPEGGRPGGTRWWLRHSLW